MSPYFQREVQVSPKQSIEQPAERATLEPHRAGGENLDRVGPTAPSRVCVHGPARGSPVSPGEPAARLGREETGAGFSYRRRRR